MKKISFYTIGHGRRKIDEFMSLLSENEIEKLVDVRSVPFSRFNPQYNQKALSATLQKENMEYVFMGDTLGGRPKDETCYDAKGKPDFNKIKQKPFFKRGISELVEKYGDSGKAAIMCSESNPAECHRCMLIGAELAQAGIELRHIDQNGEIKSQAEVLKGKSGQDLFSA